MTDKSSCYLIISIGGRNGENTELNTQGKTYIIYLKQIS